MCSKKGTTILQAAAVVAAGDICAYSRSRSRHAPVSGLKLPLHHLFCPSSSSSLPLSLLSHRCRCCSVLFAPPILPLLVRWTSFTTRCNPWLAVGSPTPSLRTRKKQSLECCACLAIACSQTSGQWRPHLRQHRASPCCWSGAVPSAVPPPRTCCGTGVYSSVFISLFFSFSLEC